MSDVCVRHEDRTFPVVDARDVADSGASEQVAGTGLYWNVGCSPALRRSRASTRGLKTNCGADVDLSGERVRKRI